MTDRVRVADDIFSTLVSSEKEAMAVWKERADFLRLKNKDLPVLDVLTCVYNAEAYIAHAIESVLLQSYPSLHLVIVTDPCTDRTEEIIREYAAIHPNITHIANREHKGIISSFNTGLEYCSHDYIARMDLDDLIHPLRFEKQMDYLLKHPDTGVVSCWMKIFNEKHETRDVYYREDFDLQKISMLFFSPLSHAGSVFRAEVLKSTGYREEFKYAEDYDLWYQIMSRYRTAVYPEFLYLYRTHSNQVTNPRNMQIIRESWFRIMKNLFNDLGLIHTDEDIRYHMDHLMSDGDITDKEGFRRYHAWIRRLILANDASGYFDRKKLKGFISLNYWGPRFERFKKDMNILTYASYVFSAVHPGGIANRLKNIIRHLLRKWI